MRFYLILSFFRILVEETVSSGWKKPWKKKRVFFFTVEEIGEPCSKLSCPQNMGTTITKKNAVYTLVRKINKPQKEKSHSSNTRICIKGLFFSKFSQI